MQNNSQNIHSDNSTDLIRFESAKALVDQIFQVNGVYSEPFLKIMIWLRQHTPEDAEDARAAMFNLMLAAFEHSSGYCDQVEAYSASLWHHSEHGQHCDQQSLPVQESTSPNLALTA